MRKLLSIAAGAAAAAVLAHGMVHCALNLADPLPFLTYRGFFQFNLFALEKLWSQAHGWPPMSDIQDFGRFYARTVHLISPLLGFSLFWLLSRHKIGRNFWRPLLIVVVMAIPLSMDSFFMDLGMDRTSLEVARALLVTLAMLASVGAFPTAAGDPTSASLPQESTTPS